MGRYLKGESMMRAPWIAAGLVVLGGAACAPEADRPAAPQLARSECRLLGAAAVDLGGLPTYRETAQLGLGPETWFDNPAGVTVSGDRVFLYDAGRTVLFEFTDDLQPLRTFGRDGDGPGEFRSVSGAIAYDGGRRQWVTTEGDRMVVFDGYRAQELDLSGDSIAFSRQVPSEAFPRGMDVRSSRLALTADGDLLYGWGGHNVLLHSQMPEGQIVYDVRRVTTTGSVATLSRVDLQRSPQFRNAPYTGSDEARPVWDAKAGCVVASDGYHPWIVVTGGPGAPNALDTLHFSLGDRGGPSGSRGEDELVGAPGANLPAPTRLSRVRDLIVDPSGTIWIRPHVRPDSRADGVEVLLVPLRRSPASAAVPSFVVDTVPAFPSAFGLTRNVYYATQSDSMGRRLLMRYESGG